jgi:hypothetical protein
MIQGEPGDERGGGDAAPEPVAAISALRTAAADVLEADLWRLPDTALLAAVAEGYAAMNQAYAAYLRLVRELDARPGAVSGARPGTSARTFLVHALRRSPFQASADVQAARALAPDADPAQGGLPRLGAALAAGQVSREHAHVAVKAVRRIPGHLLREPVTDHDAADAGLTGGDDREGGDGERDGVEGDGGTWSAGGRPWCRGDVLDKLLTEHSQQHDPATIDRLGEYLQHAADPDGSRSFDPDATHRRGLSIVRDSTGMEIIRGELDSVAGALVRAALDALSMPLPARTETAEDGTLLEIQDKRTGRERNADAMAEMARLALGAMSSGRPQEPPRLVVHTTIEELHAAKVAARPATEGTRQPQPEPETPEPARAPAPATERHAGTGSPPAIDPAEAGMYDGNRGRLAYRPGWRGAELATGGYVSPGVLAQLACDAVLQKALLAPNGAVLDLGRDTRTVTPAQRRALVARDKAA